MDGYLRTRGCRRCCRCTCKGPRRTASASLKPGGCSWFGLARQSFVGERRRRSQSQSSTAERESSPFILRRLEWKVVPSFLLASQDFGDEDVAVAV